MEDTNQIKVLLNINNDNFKVTIKTTNYAKSVSFYEFKHFLDDKYKQLFNDKKLVWQIYDKDFSEFVALEEHSVISDLSKLKAIRSPADPVPVAVPAPTAPTPLPVRVAKTLTEPVAPKRSFTENLIEAQQEQVQPKRILQRPAQDVYQASPNLQAAAARGTYSDVQMIEDRGPPMARGYPEPQRMQQQPQQHPLAQSYYGQEQVREPRLADTVLADTLRAKSLAADYYNAAALDRIREQKLLSRMSDPYGGADVSMSSRSRLPDRDFNMLNRGDRGRASSPPSYYTRPSAAARSSTNYMDSASYQTNISNPMGGYSAASVDPGYYRASGAVGGGYSRSSYPPDGGRGYRDYGGGGMGGRSAGRSQGGGGRGNASMRPNVSPRSNAFVGSSGHQNSGRSPKPKSLERVSHIAKPTVKKAPPTKRQANVPTPFLAPAAESTKERMKVKNDKGNVYKHHFVIKKFDLRKRLVNGILKYNEEFEMLSKMMNVWETDAGPWSFVAREVSTEDEKVSVKECQSMFEELLDQYFCILEQLKDWQSTDAQELWSLFNIFHVNIDIRPFRKNVLLLQKEFNGHAKKKIRLVQESSKAKKAKTESDAEVTKTATIGKVATSPRKPKAKPKKSVKISRDKENQRLIQSVANHSKDFKRKDVLDTDVWQEIATDMNEFESALLEGAGTHWNNRFFELLGEYLGVIMKEATSLSESERNLKMIFTSLDISSFMGEFREIQKQKLKENATGTKALLQEKQKKLQQQQEELDRQRKELELAEMEETEMVENVVNQAAVKASEMIDLVDPMKGAIAREDDIVEMVSNARIESEKSTDVDLETEGVKSDEAIDLDEEEGDEEQEAEMVEGDENGEENQGGAIEVEIYHSEEEENGGGDA